LRYFACFILIDTQTKTIENMKVDSPLAHIWEGC